MVECAIAALQPVLAADGKLPMTSTSTQPEAPQTTQNSLASAD
jgi:hypothetical protein